MLDAVRFVRPRMPTSSLARVLGPLAAAVLLSLLTAPAVGQKRSRTGDDRFVARSRAAQQLADFADASAHIGFRGALLVGRAGKPVIAIGVGQAAEGVPNDANTLFEIASVTKQITAAAACRLAERGRLDLDEPIGAYLDGVPESCAGITVRHLLQHTSGIPGSNSKGGGTDIDAVLPGFLEGGPRHEPGTHWEYWNQGYAILSEIIARAGGCSYTDYCQRELFGPAKLRNACFTGDDAPRGVAVAVGKSQRADRTALEHPYGEYGFQYRGMGGAVFSAWDCWRWDRALDGKKVLGKKMQQQLFEPGPGDYALGWRISEKDGRACQSHSGSVRGFLTDFRRYPESDACVIVLCNREDFRIDRIGDVLEAGLFGSDKALAPPPPPLPAQTREALLGNYRIEHDVPGATAEIVPDPFSPEVTIVRMKRPGERGTRDVWLGQAADGDGVLAYEWAEPQRVSIDRDEGAVTGLSWAMERLVRVE